MSREKQSSIEYAGTGLLLAVALGLLAVSGPGRSPPRPSEPRPPTAVPATGPAGTGGTRSAAPLPPAPAPESVVPIGPDRLAGRLDEPLVPATVRPLAPGERPEVEVVFCLDATGSMSDEIAAAKERIFAIADRVLAGEPAPEVRFGVVAYRDRGDPRELDTLALTDNLRDVYRFLGAIRADGGGDTPENVRLALKTAVEDMAWSSKPSAVKMIFLVGDAPPHEDYQDLPSCEDSALKAHAKGIAISTLACGGLLADGDGMAIWRRIAKFSGGRTEILPRGGVTATGEPDEAGKFSEIVIRSIVEEARKKGLEIR